MDPILTTRTTQNTQTSLAVRDVENTIYRVGPEQSPVLQFYMTNGRRNIQTDGLRSKFEWFESTWFPTDITLPSGLTGGSTTATVAISADYLRMYETIYVDETKDWGIVTDNTTPGQVTLKCIGGGNFTTASAGATVRIISMAMNENYSSPAAKSTNETPKYAYCQILIEPVNITGRKQATKHYSGPDWKRKVVERLEEVKRDIERMFIINGASYDDTTLDVTYSAGLRGGITTNVKYYNDSVDEVELDEFLETVMQKGKPERIMYCGSDYISDINKFLKEVWKYYTEDNIKVYGGLSKKGNTPRVLTYMGLKGPVYFVWNPILDSVGLSTSAVCIDPALIKMRYMAPDEDGPRKMRHEKSVQTPGAGNRKDQWVFDIGQQIINEDLMGWHHKSPV